MAKNNSLSVITIYQFIKLSDISDLRGNYIDFFLPCLEQPIHLDDIRATPKLREIYAFGKTMFKFKYLLEKEIKFSHLGIK